MLITSLCRSISYVGILLTCVGNVSLAEGARRDVIAAAPGRIEGADDVIPVGTSATAIVKEVLITEGAHVHAGQPLVQMDCKQIEDEVRGRAGSVAALSAVVERLRNGPRPEEMSSAHANLRLAQARAEEAEAAYQRIKGLTEGVTATRAQLLAAQRDARISAAQLEDSQAKLDLLKAGARQEDIAEAEGRRETAIGSMQEAQTRLEQCTVRAPSNGIILKTYAKPGQFFSSAIPTPLIRLVDDSEVRVRAEVDEHDIGRICAGQRALITTDPFPDASLESHVQRINPGMGRRSILNGDPGEKSHHDVREVILSIDKVPAEEWPIGLRVVVLFQSCNVGRGSL